MVLGKILLRADHNQEAISTLSLTTQQLSRHLVHERHLQADPNVCKVRSGTCFLPLPYLIVKVLSNISAFLFKDREEKKKCIS